MGIRQAGRGKWLGNWYSQDLRNWQEKDPEHCTQRCGIHKLWSDSHPLNMWGYWSGRGHPSIIDISKYKLGGGGTMRLSLTEIIVNRIFSTMEKILMRILTSCYSSWQVQDEMKAQSKCCDRNLFMPILYTWQREENREQFNSSLGPHCNHFR